MSFTYYLCPWRQGLEESLPAQRTCGFVARCEPFILWNERKWKQPVSEGPEAFEIIHGCTFCWFWKFCRIEVINGDRLRTSLRMRNYSVSSALVTFYRIWNLWFERDSVIVPIRTLKLNTKSKLSSFTFIKIIEYLVSHKHVRLQNSNGCHVNFKLQIF